MVEHIHGMFSLYQLVFIFDLRQSEADAKASIRNGVVKVNGKTIVNPDEMFSLVRLNELQCGRRVVQLNRK